MTAATEIRPSHRLIREPVSSWESATDTIPPRPASATIAFDRTHAIITLYPSNGPRIEIGL
ncbi:hypothetical protein AB0454_44160, partial [Streptomyces sp. NPDC093509]